MVRQVILPRHHAHPPTLTTAVTPAVTTSGPPTAVSAPAVGYGSPDFERAGHLVRARAGIGETPARRTWFLDVRGIAALVRLVRQEQVLDVTLTRSARGARIARSLRPRTLGLPRNRLCAAVWPVPADLADRPSGNRYRALRSALNAADRTGLTVAPAVSVADRLRCAAAAVADSPRLSSWAERAPHRPEETWWAAYDRLGRPVGLAAVVVDERWASLVTLIGIGDAKQASTARFLLHHAVTRALSEQQVEYLAVLDDSPLLVDAGARHIQRVLGYQLARLRRPRTVDPRPARRVEPTGISVAG